MGQAVPCLGPRGWTGDRKRAVGLIVLVRRRVFVLDGPWSRAHGKVDPLAIDRSILAAVATVKGVAIDLGDGTLGRAMEEPGQMIQIMCQTSIWLSRHMFQIKLKTSM